MASSAPANTPASAGYAPFAQLIKMLLPSARSVALYDTRPELVWCSDGYERPDLRALVDPLRAGDAAATRGSVETTKDGLPVFVSALRGASGQPLGSVVVELGGGNSRSTPSMVVSMLRPVLDCLESQLDLEHSTLAADRSAGLDLLLRADARDDQETSALQELLNHCAKELRCVTGALLVPDKNLELSWTADAASAESKLLDRTQKHLLAWARLINRPMVVNKPGGAGAPGRVDVIKSAPDGYTLLFGFGSGEDIVVPHQRQVPYDPMKDFDPVCRVSIHSIVLAVNSESPYKSVDDLVKAAKSKGNITAAVAGKGAANDITAQAFGKAAGISVTTVPGSGGAEAVTRLLGGHSDFATAHPSEVLPHVKAGRLRALAATTASRLPALPAVPTVSEAALKGYETVTWFGFVAPAKTPPEAITRLNTVILKVLALPDIRTQFDIQGMEILGGTPERFGSYIREEIAKWAKVIRLSGAKAD